MMKKIEGQVTETRVLKQRFLKNKLNLKGSRGGRAYKKPSPTHDL
jgi:hypothetical protein